MLSALPGRTNHIRSHEGNKDNIHTPSPLQHGSGRLKAFPSIEIESPHINRSTRSTNMLKIPIRTLPHTLNGPRPSGTQMTNDEHPCMAFLISTHDIDAYWHVPRQHETAVVQYICSLPPTSRTERSRRQRETRYEGVRALWTTTTDPHATA